MTDTTQPELTKNEQEHRYELTLDGEVIGLIDYRDRGDVVVLPHTEVDSDHEGKGYAALIAKFALDDVRAQGKRVKPTCPFVAKYIGKHPEYADLVAS